MSKKKKFFIFTGIAALVVGAIVYFKDNYVIADDEDHCHIDWGKTEDQ